VVFRGRNESGRWLRQTKRALYVQLGIIVIDEEASGSSKMPSFDSPVESIANKDARGKTHGEDSRMANHV
jgi:hypothetical protein